MTLKQLQRAARVVKNLLPGPRPDDRQEFIDVTLSIRSQRSDGEQADKVVKAMLALGARHETMSDDVFESVTLHVIESAQLDVDGVSFRAQFARPATAEELAAERPS